MKIKTENAALKALNENPFVLGKVSKHLWKKPSLLRQAFGIFEKGSPDRLGALEDLIDKLENNWKISSMKPGDVRTELGRGFFGITCYEVIEYEDSDGKDCKAMFFCVSFQAEPILIYLGMIRDHLGIDAGDYRVDIKYFRDENGTEDFYDVWRRQELMDDLDKLFDINEMQNKDENSRALTIVVSQDNADCSDDLTTNDLWSESIARGLKFKYQDDDDAAVECLYEAFGVYIRVDELPEGLEDILDFKGKKHIYPCSYISITDFEFSWRPDIYPTISYNAKFEIQFKTGKTRQDLDKWIENSGSDSFIVTPWAVCAGWFLTNEQEEDKDMRVNLIDSDSPIIVIS